MSADGTSGAEAHERGGETAALTTRAKTVIDMFDLAGAAVRPVVARLLPVSGGEPLEVVEGDQRVFRVGRSKDIPYPFRIDNARLSSFHCELRLTPATLVVEIVDLSTNGTFLNGVRLEKGRAVALQPGDTVALLNPATAAGGDEKSSRLEFLFQRLKASSKEEQLVEELSCGVCRQVFYRACTLLPCLHVFCGSCISHWLKSHTQCPECRTEVYEVRPTHKINNVVEQLLIKRPDLKRSAEEQAECDKAFDIPPTGKVIRKRPRESDDDGGGSDAGGGSDSDSDSSEGESVTGGGLVVAPSPFGFGLPPHLAPLHGFHYTAGHFGTSTLPATSCLQCVTPAADGYQCPAGAIHVRCFSCKTAFPERPLCGIPQRCELCQTPFCDLYLGGCKNPAGVGYLQPVKDHVLEALPARLFNGNTIEQSILSSYLATAGTSVQSAWADCVKKFTEGTWHPDIPGPGLSTASTVCRPCCQRIFSGLLYHYRRAIPREALPANVTSRPNCWYGKECRTQHKNLTHAQTFNHACPQEKRKE